MENILFEILVILLLIILNGLLAMSEMAIVSAKKPRLQQLATSGNRAAKVALDLAADPSSFLASIQIGITLIGIFAGAFGGATIAEELAPFVGGFPALASYAEGISLSFVVTVVTFLSLIVGELVPKRIALTHAEKVALLTARPMRYVAGMAMPIVHVLSMVTEALLKVIGVANSTEPLVTEEEVKIMIDQGTEAGAFAKEEGSMMKRVLAFGDRRVGELMTPRPKIVGLDLDAHFRENMEIACKTPHSYFPVYQGNPDNFVGIVTNKAILDGIIEGKNLDIHLKDCITEALFVSESMPTLSTLEKFKQTGKRLALVVDEYGAVSGLITLTDLLEAIVGDLPSGHDHDDDQIIRREDGSFLVDGTMLVDELAELLRIEKLPEGHESDFQSLGGFIMHELGHIPKEGEYVDWSGFRFEVVDMDGRRVDKVLLKKMPDVKV